MSTNRIRDLFQEKLKEIVEHFPSLSSEIATLENDVILLNAIIFWMPHRSTEEFRKSYNGFDITERFDLMMERFSDIECSPSTPEASMDNLITYWMLDLEDIKSATKKLYAIHLEIDYSDEWGLGQLELHQIGVSTFVDDLAKVQVYSNKEGVTSVQNLKAYQDLSSHLAMVCTNNSTLVDQIWQRARAVADHTAMLLCSCLFESDTDLNEHLKELCQSNWPMVHQICRVFLCLCFSKPDTNLQLKLTQLLQMTDPTHPAASAFYFKIFNSVGFFHQIPLPDTDEMNFIDHLLLYLKNQILQCQECHAIFVCEKLMACETIVKAIVSYSPLSTKMILYGSILKHVTTVLSLSSPINFEEKKLDESFDQFLHTLINSGFIYHLLRCGNKSLKDQLEEFSHYMTFLKAFVSCPQLRYMWSKIVLRKVIVKLVITALSLSSIDTEVVEDNTGKEKNLIFPAEFDVPNFIDEWEKIMEHDIKYEEIEKRGIEQYIDGLEEVQKKYLSSNKQAITFVQNLRSFEHLIKVTVNWYNNKDLWNNHQSQLLVALQHTTTFLCSCWIEPEKNQEFKTLEQYGSSTWRNVLAEASFIDHMLFYLKELIQCQTRSLVASLKEQLENLHWYLTSLRNIVPMKDIVPSSRHQYIVPSRMRSFHSLVIKFVMSMEKIFVTDSKDAEKETLALFHDLEENVTLMKTELRKSFIFDFPSIGFELFSIFKNLDEMLTFRSDVIAPMKHQFDMVYTGLLKLTSFMDKIKDRPIENKKQVKGLRQRIIQVSHRADFIIQSYVNRDVGDGPTYYYALQLLVVMEDIKILLTEIEGLDTDDTSYVTAEENYNQRYSEGSTPNITEIVVGFKDVSETILAHLIGRSKSRNIVAIVGMPGLGKTTIAKKVYNHTSVANLFERRAWCCVSQTYQRKELLLRILRSIEVNDDQILKKSDDEIAAMLFKCLKKRRYLIVLDDVWETKAWEDLERSFPDDNNQSRVLITSRNRQVAKKLIQATPYSYLHPLREFHYSESYKLLQQKLFPQFGFPTELCDVAMMIANNCRGLPLAVVLAAGILLRMEKREAHWIKFAESLSKQIVNDEGNQCKNLIELSYTHLPDHLKCCFLYFGAFPEDEEISVKKLTWLWIAEGFISDANRERLEDIAEHYLMDLIGRSLVIGSMSASRPGMKSCHVHDLLHDFCLVKAEEENFLQVVRGYNKYLIPNTINIWKIPHRQYRLSIYSKRKHFIMADPSGPNVRTLFFHALGESYFEYAQSHDASFIFRYFKLIKVLDLGSINIGDSLTEVALMLHLRFLAVNGDIKFIPKSIENLWKLETFILESYSYNPILIPNSIWRLLRLRHLHIESYSPIKLDSEGIVNSAILPDMESFSTPTMSYGDDVERLLHRLPNLRKLKCKFLDSWDDSEKCNRFPVLEFVTQLVSLTVSWNSISDHSSQWPCRFSFPSNLTKLTLSKFGLPWSEISAIGKLPKLISLKLLSGAFTGKRWDMSEGDFLALKFLKLESLDIKVWSATKENIPNLQRLMLSKCERLKEIPSGIGDIETLEIIEVLWCTRSAATSARNIQEIAEEYGNDTPKVHIYPNEEYDGASSS